MKKLTLLLAGLMIVGTSFAGGGDKCCKGKKETCSKEKKEKCEKGTGCCQKKSTEKKS